MPKNETAPTEQELSEIRDLLEHAAENTVSVDEIKTLKQSNPEVLEQLVEAHTIGVLGMRVSVLFEEHEGGLFQHVRVYSEKDEQPSFRDCMNLLPHFGISENPDEWAHSWGEVTAVVDENNDEVEVRKMVFNVAQMVRPPKKELQ